METKLILFGGVVWLVYMVWTRRANPPIGIWRWGIWLPLAYCFYGIHDGIMRHLEFNRLMTSAEAMTQPQKELFRQQAVFSVIKLLLVGVVGTLFIYMTIKRPSKAENAGSATDAENAGNVERA